MSDEDKIPTLTQVLQKGDESMRDFFAANTRQNTEAESEDEIPSINIEQDDTPPDILEDINFDEIMNTISGHANSQPEPDSNTTPDEADALRETIDRAVDSALAELAPVLKQLLQKHLDKK